MKYLALVLKSARRSKRRTALTIVSVALAVFLFATLRAVLDGFTAGAAASSSTRIITIRSTSLIFSMPTSHADAIRSVPGVRDLTWANWFGGIYKDQAHSFANFAIEPESYLRMYPEILLSADERSLVKGQAGWFITRIASPDQEAQVAGAIDAKFANSPYETKTDTEKAFASSFISMFGNLNLLLGSIALAVVVATLFVAGNTMAMSVRERTTEIAVMRTLGFPGGTIFSLIAIEALLMSIVGGVVGVVLARIAINPRVLPSGGFIPEVSVDTQNIVVGLGLSAVIGAVSGLIPATLAARLKIVDALRRVA